MTSLAIAHEWLALRAGSEKTFEAMAQAFPDADLYALTQTPGVPFDFGGRPVRTTFLDRAEVLRDRRELTLPLMPLAWRTLRARRSYDQVLTSSHACVKGFVPGRSAQHFCYVYAPLRYAWDPQIDARAARGGAPVRKALGALRRWDRRSVEWVDHFAGISSAVRDRIRRFYDRDARVIFPPVDTDYFTPGDPGARGERALAVSRFIPYKRLDLAIEACAITRTPLTIAGSGPHEGALRDRARELRADVEFVLSPTDDQLRELYRTSRVVIFPANEDFGIVPVEAQACGTPALGLDEGGTRDTVLHEKTGFRAARQTAEDFGEGLQALLDKPPDADACIAHAQTFSKQRFIDEVRDWLGHPPA